MGRIQKITIEESAEELLALSRKVRDPLAQARLRAYYLYKTGQVQDYAAIGQQLSTSKKDLTDRDNFLSYPACERLE